MGYPDFGGGQPAGHSHGPGSLSVASLTGPSTGTPDVAVSLTARKQDGRYTLNGTTPGPDIRAVKGQLIQVTLVNDNISDGITLHWHGVDVPNGADGVADMFAKALTMGGTGLGLARQLLASMNSGDPEGQPASAQLNGAVTPPPRSEKIPVRDDK